MASYPAQSSQSTGFSKSAPNQEKKIQSTSDIEHILPWIIYPLISNEIYKNLMSEVED